MDTEDVDPNEYRPKQYKDDEGFFYQGIFHSYNIYPRELWAQYLQEEKVIYPFHCPKWMKLKLIYIKVFQSMMIFVRSYSNATLAKTPFSERYLLYFGYIGTKFRGVDKETTKHRRYEVDTCLISVMEESLNNIDSYTKEKNLCISSRTDAGVHALNSTAHCDLWIPAPYIKKIKYSRGDYVAHQLNKFFSKNNDDIRIFKAVHVPKLFHARFHAISRTYLYRFGVIDKNKDYSNVSFKNLDALIPMAELNRTHFIKAVFDLNLANEACSLLIGEKDFGGFTSLKKNYSHSSIRNIFQMHISSSQPLMNPCYDSNYNGLKFYNMTVTASSFCYRQVRRMMTVILAIGTGQFELDYIKMLLHNPKTSHLHDKLRAVPAYGLYLINVEYPPESFIFEEDISSPLEDFKDYSNSNFKDILENR